MAGDPQIDEDKLLFILDPDNDISLPALRVSFYVAVVCAYDRKVEREFFGDVLEIMRKATALQATMEVGKSICEWIKEQDSKRDCAVLQEGMEAAVQEMQGYRKEMYNKLKLVAQCPTSDDKLS